MTQPFKLHHGDCIEVMRAMPDNSVDSVVTDPPYELGFMGKKWDATGVANDPVMWSEVLRVLKPGGHLLAFSGSRTYHRMTCAIEDAGFEIRDQIMWVYSSGFPKSHNLDKLRGVSICGCTNGTMPYDHKRTQQKTERNLRSMPSSDVSTTIDPSEERGEVLFEGVQEQGSPANARQQPACTEIRCGQSCVEGRCDHLQEEGQLQGHSVCKGTGLAETYGTQGRLHHGASSSDGDMVRVSSNARGSGASRRSQPTEQRKRQSRTVAHEQESQAMGAWQVCGECLLPMVPEGWGTALKPSFEPLCVAHKPLSTETEQDIINANLFILERRLWSLLLVSAVETSSTSNQSELSVGCAIAQWSVDEAISTRDALCEVMGTSQFELATNTSLSIVSSWRRTLDELSKVGSMSITETKSSTTTDWKTLNFCLSQITLRTIILASLDQFGLAASASTAERYFDAELKRLQCTLELSALATAISQDRLNSLDVDAKVKHEPICVARKPLIGTVAANVMEYGTGAINIEACRVPTDESTIRSEILMTSKGVQGGSYGSGIKREKTGGMTGSDAGRWPANLIHDGSADVVACFPDAKGQQGSVTGEEPSSNTNNVYGNFNGRPASTPRSDTGSAARFFYCAKASRADRNEGLASGNTPAVANGATMREREDADWSTRNGNHHPTVKPTELMAYLCRLVTPPNGVVLDPFMGSGSTGKAAIREGFAFIGIEREQEYIDIARARIEHACGIENGSQVQMNMELF